jgi:hypothetical protein
LRPGLIILTPFLLITGLAVYFWPMGNDDVPQYITITAIVQGKHNSAFSHGPNPVVTLAVHNSQPWRTSPSNLWVACDAAGTNDDAGSYADKLVAFEAEPMHTVRPGTGAIRAGQQHRQSGFSDSGRNATV